MEQTTFCAFKAILKQSSQVAINLARIGLLNYIIVCLKWLARFASYLRYLLSFSNSNVACLAATGWHYLDNNGEQIFNCVFKSNSQISYQTT